MPSVMLLTECFSATSSGFRWGIRRLHAVTEGHSKSFLREKPRTGGAGFLTLSLAAPAGGYASVKFRVTVGSTGIPGPVVVETTTFFT